MNPTIIFEFEEPSSSYDAHKFSMLDSIIRQHCSGHLYIVARFTIRFQRVMLFGISA
jgi:hypothetical protein